MAPEYLKGRARVLWLRRINFGQCLGAYVHSDGLEGPYLYRFDEHPKSYRLPTIVELAIFFIPARGIGKVASRSGLGVLPSMCSAHGVWINQGIIDASTPNGSLTIERTAIENSNVLEATNGGLLSFSVAPVHNAAQGVIEAKGENSEVIMGVNLGSGIVTNAGLIAAVHSGTVLMQDVIGLDNTNGTIEADHGSTVLLEDATINGGFVTVLKGGLLESEPHQQSFAPNTITGAAVTNAGTIGAEGANLTIIGDVTNTGTLDANNATLLIEGACSERRL
jgi:hypothetical protein